MRKIILLLILFSSAQLMAQQSVKGLKANDIHRFFSGGNLGLSFGSETYIDIEPILGYKITDHLQAGVGFKYIYDKTNYYGIDYHTNIIGGMQFSRLFLFKNIFAEQEFEYNNYSQPIGIDANNNLVYGHAGFPALFVGGGLYQPISGNAGFTMMVLYDLIQDPHSYYNSPLSIRGGINFGF